PAYLMPILDRISRNAILHTSALILAPTRELALQIDQALQGFAYFTHASSIAVYGGSGGQVFEQEKRSLMHGASVIIATPGSLLSHLNLGYVKFNLLDCLVLVFASTKEGVKALERELRRANLAAKAISSDLTQQEREEVLLAFRNKRLQILVATDILSRGIDIEDIELVVNYDVPADAEDYV